VLHASVISTGISTVSDDGT